MVVVLRKKKGGKNFK